MRFKKIRHFFQFFRFKLDMRKSENEALRWAKGTSYDLTRQEKKEFRNKVTWNSYKQRNTYWYVKNGNIVMEYLYDKPTIPIAEECEIKATEIEEMYEVHMEEFQQKRLKNKEK